MTWKLAIIFQLFISFSQQDSSTTSGDDIGSLYNGTTNICNLSALPFLRNDVIHLNISWDLYQDETKACRIDVFYGGLPEPFHIEVNMHEENYVILPDTNTIFKFKPGRRYHIEFGCTDCELDYVIPDCVGKVCNCQKMKSEAKLDMKQTSSGQFQLNWLHFGPYKLSNVTFRHIHNDTSTTPISIPDNPDPPENGSYVVDVKYEPGNEIEIEGIFINDKFCPTFALSKIVPETKTWMGYTQMAILCAIVFAAIAVAICYISVSRSTKSNILFNKVPKQTGRRAETRNVLYVSQIEIQHDVYEYSYDKLDFIKEINSGAFGVVYLAKAIDLYSIKGWTYVAAKMQKDCSNHEEREDFLNEINTMKKVGYHPNVVRLLGYCSNEPRVVIMEYIPCGDLKHYLLDLRESWDNLQNNVDPVVAQNSDYSYINFENSPDSGCNSLMRPSTSSQSETMSEERSPLVNNFQHSLEKILDHTELQNFALQIAKGMAHLEKIPITHRDLAARNVLINEFKVLKITDFGMSRSGTYINQKSRRVPFRWMAIESIEDSFYDNKSDVWSFGVVLWEIGTLGAFPYKEIPDQTLVHNLLKGHRLQRPEVCTDYLYQLMMNCWEHNPKNRPTFQELVQFLDVKKNRVYVDFAQINPCYIFPPSTQ